VKFKLMISVVLMLILTAIDWLSVLPKIATENFLGAKAVAQVRCDDSEEACIDDDPNVSEPPCPYPDSPCIDAPRGSLPKIHIVSPSGGALSPENTTPMLSWSAIPGATTYNVRLENYRGIVWDLETDRTQTAYPENKPALEPDTDYELIVETIVGDRLISGQVTFRLLGQEEANRVSEQVRAIEQNSALSDEQKLVQLAILYRDNYLFTRAIATLESGLQSNPQSAAINQMLGNLYLKVKLPELAEPPFNRALNLATTAGERADARIGLARVKIANEDWDGAIEHLTAARENYQSANNLEIAAQLAQFIGEVYEKSGNIQAAIQWFEDAKTEYQDLGQQDRVDYLEEKLANLR